MIDLSFGNIVRLFTVRHFSSFILAAAAVWLWLRQQANKKASKLPKLRVLGANSGQLPAKQTACAVSEASLINWSV